MEFVQPKAIMIASTAMEGPGMKEMLKALGAPDWDTDTDDGSEKLAEVAGRLCYKSFGTGLNPNLTKVRDGNADYLKNVIESGHGSVLEHGSVSFAFINVSRVFTHELVRHRAGMAYSQESLRFVRLDQLKAWFPHSFAELGDLVEPEDVEKWGLPTSLIPAGAFGTLTRADFLEYLFANTMEMLEHRQRLMAKMLQLDDLPFSLKKKYTSAMRRLAPIGLATNIVATGNHRAWRHVLEMRGGAAAEEEIHMVITDVAKQLRGGFPNIYGDMSLESGMLDGEVKFHTSKV